MEKLQKALADNIWMEHRVGDTYKMDGSDKWKIAYYPIFENGKNNEVYDEARALVEKPILGKFGEVVGTDFREVPLRYLNKHGNK